MPHAVRRTRRGLWLRLLAPNRCSMVHGSQNPDKYRHIPDKHVQAFVQDVAQMSAVRQNMVLPRFLWGAI